MFDIKKVKTSSFAYELDISKIIAKLHLAAAKFTKESANNKICITANSGIKNDDIKSPNPETPSSKLQFLIDDGPNYTVSIVAICKDLVNEYSLFNKPEYYDVATSMSTYENNDNKNKTQLDDMIETIEDNKQYVVPVMYQSKKDIFNKCFSEVKTIRENNEKAARETIAALFSNYFENFMGKEAATAANASNLVYLDEVDIVDVIKDFEQQYKESGLLEYSNKLKDAHNKLIDKLNKEKPINNNSNNNTNTNNSNNSNNNTNTNNSNNSNTAQQHESKQTTFNNLMSLLFEDNPPQENNNQNNNQNNTDQSKTQNNNQNNNQNNTDQSKTQNNNQSNNQNNTDQKQAETSTNDENNKNNENNKLNVKFPEKVDKIYAYAVGYSLDVKQE